jgi:hypothetical protein
MTTPDDLVVGLGGRQSCRQSPLDRFGLQEQAAAGQFARRPVEGDALVDGVVHAADDFVEQCA